MDFPCFHCNTITKLDVKLDIAFFSCPSCSTLYSKNENDQFVYRERFNKDIYNNGFTIGQKAQLLNDTYTIIGLLIKRYNAVSRWAEYILQNTTGDFIYLSESDGNFIILQQIDFEKKVGNHPLKLEYENMVFDRYDYSYPKLVDASGYFDYNVLNKIELIEYIKPPYILSVEKFEQEQTTYYGKHISRSDIKKAFGTSPIPYKSKIGIIQPFIFNITNLVITFCFIAILLFLTNWFLNKDRVEKEVLNTTLPFAEYGAIDYVSPSFELKGNSAPLKIAVSSNVDNSWANIQVALVNESTNEEIFASKDVEYYHGYTDGESWTEGSTSEDFNICGVAAGKYHLNMTPIKASEDAINTAITVSVSWAEPSLNNVFFTLFFMLVFVVIMYYLAKYFEEKRWAE